jgi:DNA-binding LacI/PurR family transcriptional regulator
VGDWTARSGYLIGKEMEIEPGTAVFASNDLMAMGLMAALRERGLSVPGDVSLVGFDDVPEAAYLYPPLTTVRQDFAALGELMMQKVLLALEEDEPATPDTPLPTRLVVRESTRER